MAFVTDPNDPSSLGMFSKPGRYTSEKYIIFQKKDEIINNQRKFLKVTNLPHLKMDFDTKDHRKETNEEENTRPKHSYSKSVSRPEPFSAQLSREEYYQVKKVKHPPPPCGFYNPKYSYVESVPQPLFKYEKEKSKPKNNTTLSEQPSEEELLRPIPRKIERKVVGPLLFHLQTPKGTLLSPNNHPHEERFNYHDIPEASGRSKRVTNVDMRKTLGRDLKFLYKNQEHSPDYSPNYDFGRKTGGSCGPKFDTNSPRKPMHHTSSCTNENWFTLGKKEELTFGRTRETFFNKYSARESDPQSPLPSFMQKSINSRLAIGTLRMKTLETNGFSDGKFQTVHTSFFPKKKSERDFE